MRMGCLLPLVSVVLIVGGGQSVYVGLKNRTPTEIDIRSLDGGKPSAKWLKITGGVLDTLHGSYVTGLGGGDARELYVPLVAPGTDSSKSPIHILVLTKDPGLLNFMNQARELEHSTTTTDSDTTEFFLENLEKLHVAGTVQGIVKFGIDGDDKSTRKIREHYKNLDADAIVIEEDASPSTGKGFAMLAGGLLLGGILIASSGKKRTPAAPLPPGGPPPLPPGTHP